MLFQEIPSVYGASRYEQKVTEAPSSVSIVTSADIKHYGYRNLGEILESVPGLYTTYDRNYSYLGMRGFARAGDYNTRVLLLVDGHRLNDAVYDQAPIGTDFPVDVDLIDRVEIIRGPSSSIYGTNAFLGVINVITKRGRDLRGSEVSGEYGSYETYRGRYTYGNRTRDGVEFLLSGSYYDSLGDDHYYRPFRHSHRGIASNCDDERFYGLFSKASYQDFTLMGVFHSREKGIPTAPWDVIFNDPSTRTTDHRAFLDLKYDRELGDRLDLSAHLYYDHYRYDGDYAYWQDPDRRWNRVLQKDYARGEMAGADVQLTKRWLENHKLLLGSEYRGSFRQDQGTYDNHPYRLLMKERRDAYNWAVYLQDEYRIFSNLLLNAGVRYDQYETFGGSTNPRLALIFNPIEKSALKLIYGQAFRAPNSYELFYTDRINQKANPDLDPENMTTYELVWEQRLTDRLRLSATGYYYEIEDLISLTRMPNGFLMFKNVENVQAKGLEFELDSRWPGGIEGRVSYCLQRTEDERSGNMLPNSPKQMVKLNVLCPLIQHKLTAGTELQYLSPRRTLRDNKTQDALIANLTFHAPNVVKGLDVSAGVYNLLDQDYGDPGSAEHLQDIIQQNGINFRLKITYSF